MIGLLTLQAGAATIFVTDIDDTRLELARELGANHTLNSRDPNCLSDLLLSTKGRGADAVLPERPRADD